MDGLKSAISSRSVRRRVHELELHGLVALKKLYSNEANWIKLLNYVKMYQNKEMTFWKYVLWSNEPKYNLFGSDGKVMA